MSVLSLNDAKVRIAEFRARVDQTLSKCVDLVMQRHATLLQHSDGSSPVVLQAVLYMRYHVIRLAVASASNRVFPIVPGAKTPAVTVSSRNAEWTSLVHPTSVDYSRYPSGLGASFLLQIEAEISRQIEMVAFGRQVKRKGLPRRLALHIDQTLSRQSRLLVTALRMLLSSGRISKAQASAIIHRLRTELVDRLFHRALWIAMYAAFSE
eukprot:ANDGO_00941.mRNA.1 hypothetical protein